MDRARLRAAAPEALAWAGFALSLGVLFLRLGGARPGALHDWYSSDTLVFVNVATDVLGDGFPLSGWRFSIVTFLFPDVFLTALLWLLTRGAMAATVLAGFALPALIVGALLLVRRAVGLGARSVQAVLTLGAASAITLYASAHLDIGLPNFFLLYTPENHVGCLINSLWALGLALTALRCEMEARHVGWGLYAAYAALCAAAGLSNLMFFPEFLVGLAAALALAVFFRVLPWRCCWRMPAVGWIAAALGAVSGRLVFHSAEVSRQARISQSAFVEATSVFLHGATQFLLAGEALHVLALVWLTACLAATALVVRNLAAGNDPGTGWRLGFVVVVSAAC